MNEGLQKLVPAELTAEWQAVRELSGGGQSRTILVRSTRTGAQAVLKLIKTDHDTKAQARLEREVQILKSFKHPNIVDLIEANPAAAPPWYLTPYGMPLREYWKGRRELLEPAALFDEAFGIVTGLLGGLNECHKRRIVHRDVKPGNVILLGAEKTPVAIDFGIAYVHEEPRITDTADHPVANRLIAPPEAYYGKTDEPTAWWDCLGIAWLWGWMLMAGPEPKSYHYDPAYHPFVQDPRCERVRALWSGVAVRSIAPKDAGEMLEVMARIGLEPTRRGESVVERPDPVLAEARTAFQAAEARVLSEKAEKEKSIEAASGLLAAIYTDFCGTVNPRIAEMVRERMPVAYNPVHALGSVFRMAGSHPQPAPVPIFSVTCGTEVPRRFHIALEVTYDGKRIVVGVKNGELLPFFFDLKVWHDNNIFTERLCWYHRTNGAVFLMSTVSPDFHRVSVRSELNPAEAVILWLRRPDFWSKL